MIKSVQSGEQLSTRYTYDNNKSMTGLQVSLGEESIVQNYYRYDNNGNLIEKQQKTGNTTYFYDNLNRVAKVEYPTYSEDLYYSKANNRTKRISNGVEELYKYDARNQLQQYTKDVTTSHYTYDNTGNLLKDEKTSYQYDGFNRVVQSETIDGNIQINRYDAEGLRHEIEENGRLVQFIFSGRSVVTETTETETIRLIRGYDIVASESDSARTYYHYACDEMGSTTHITRDKEILNTYEYDAFGNTVREEEKVPNRYQYVGQQKDPITQQYYLRARYYNPVIGRFTQEDVYRGDGLNLYAYCGNNPVGYYDPSGYGQESVWSKVASKILGALKSLKYNNSSDLNYYIIYTTGKGSDFTKQAKYQENKLKDLGHKVEMLPISTRAEFEDAWEGMGKINGKAVAVGDVYIYSHGTERALIIENNSPTEGLSINGWNKKHSAQIGNLNDLQEKTMNALYLYSCNSGHLDQYFNGTVGNGGLGNVASIMSEKVLNGAVYAFDGNISFGERLGLSIFTGNYEPRLATFNQEVFNDVARKYGIDTNWRNPRGRITYNSGEYKPYGFYPNTTISSAK